jgi:DNA repair protein RadA/Sms
MQALWRGLNAAQPVTTLSHIEAADVARTPTGLEELDRVLGGGIVSGGVVLIGGDPGIGKSTLLLQALDALSRQMPVLYVTGEESGAQVAMRAHRWAWMARRCGCRPRSSSRTSSPPWRPKSPPSA